jgi:hypothetical protein
MGSGALKQSLFLELIDPFDVRARAWVIRLDPSGIHAVVRRRLFLRSLASGLYVPAGGRRGGLPSVPPGTTRVAPLEQVSTALDTEPLENLRRQPRFEEGSLLSDLLGEFLEGRRIDGISFAEALRLIEGVTPTMTPDPKSQKRFARMVGAKRNVSPTRDETIAATVAAGILHGPRIRDFRRRWKERLFPPEPRSHPLLELLEEYEFLTGELNRLKPDGEPLWPILRGNAGAEGRLAFRHGAGLWSCQLPRGWLKRADPSWAPSQWAEYLLSIAHHTNTREMKRQLADGREERRICAAWNQYGAWLRDHDQALRDVERLLAVSIVRTGGQQ